MSPRVRLAVVAAGAVLSASLGTYVLAAAVGIQNRAATGHKRFGPADRPVEGLVSGSSLTYGGINWNQVAAHMNTGVESWPVPGSAPPEWEQLQRRSPRAKMTFVGVSAYDLNEVSICEYRANIVPFRQTVADLRASRSSHAYARRMASWYALTWTRYILPTAGRSDRVMFGLRDRARALLGSSGADEQVGDALQVAGDSTPEERISDWPEDRVLRRLASMRANQGAPWFSGPKHLALVRLLQQARRQGIVVVVVLPVSRVYSDDILDDQATAGFEAALANASRAVPEATWVRLDRLEGLSSTDYFFDLVHLNAHGQRIATPAFLQALGEATVRE